MNSNPLPNFSAWLLGQGHRQDMIGALARLSLTESEKIRQIGFNIWLDDLIAGKIMLTSIVEAQSEFTHCITELTETGHSESFPLSIRAIAERDGTSSWSVHKENQDISGEMYLHGLHKALGMYMANIRRLYLDTNYWINLRDAELGRAGPKEANFSNLLICLRDQRSKGRVICPISFPLFQELLKQSDNRTRRAMAALMDELSAGTCIQTPDTIERIELKRLFLQSLLGSKAPDLNEWIWTKVGAVCGEWFVEFKSRNLPKADVNAFQKVMIDEMWGMSVLALAEFPRLTENPALDNLTASFQALAKDHRERNSTFEKVLEDEKVRHTNSLLRTSMETLLAEIQTQFPSETAQFKADPTSTRDFDPQVLASIQVRSAIHSSFIVQTPTMNLESNDIIDAVHSAMALPYFDAVCVDKGLSHRLKTPPLNFDRIYPAAVLSSFDELMSWLGAL